MAEKPAHFHFTETPPTESTATGQAVFRAAVQRARAVQQEQREAVRALLEQRRKLIRSIDDDAMKQVLRDE